MHGIARLIHRFSFLLFTLIIVACGGGGGGGGGNSNPSAPAADTIVAGNAVKGVIKNARVEVFAIEDGIVGSLAIATTTTDSNGDYTITVSPGLTGSVLIKISNNNDPASPSTMTCDSVTGCNNSDGTFSFGDDMPLGDLELTTVVASMTGGSTETAAITPFTHMAAAYAETLPGGLTSENIATANSKVGNMLGINNIVTTIPPDITASASAETSFNESKYAYLSAAIVSLAESNYAGDIGTVIETLTNNYTSNDGELISSESVDDNTVISLSELAVHAWDQSFSNNADGQVENALENLVWIALNAQDELTNTMPSPSVGLGELETVKAFVADVRTWGNVIDQEINNNASQFKQELDIADVTFDIATPLLTDAFNYGMTAAFEAYITGAATASNDLSTYFSPSDPIDPVTAIGTVYVTETASESRVVLQGTINDIAIQFTMVAPPAAGNTLSGNDFELVVSNVSVQSASASITAQSGTVTVSYSETTDLTPWLNDASGIAFPDPDSGSVDLSNVAIAEVDSADPISYSGSLQAEIVGSRGAAGTTVLRDELGNVVQYNPASINFTGNVSNSTNEISGQIAATMPNAETFIPVMGPQAGDIVPALGSYTFTNNNNTVTISAPGLTRTIDFAPSTGMITVTNTYDLSSPFSTDVGTYASLNEYLTSGQYYVDYLPVYDADAYYQVVFPDVWNIAGGSLDGVIIWANPVPEENETNFRELTDILISFTAQLEGLPEAMFIMTGNRTGYRSGDALLTIAYGGRRIELEGDFTNGDATGTIDITNQDGVVITYSKNNTTTPGHITYNGEQYAEIEEVNGITLIRYNDGFFDSL
ncbi:MAG: hypothetical protein PVH98_11800 [Gammaproteobacteria bacterium]|jgi:hypothetical protein